MRSTTEKRLASTFIFVIAAFNIARLVTIENELWRVGEPAIEEFWVYRYYPDLQQRSIRITIALIIGAMAVRSRKGAKVALIIFGLLYPAFEILIWVASRNHVTFKEPEYITHIVAGLIFLSAILLWFYGSTRVTISILASVYILFEYLIWYLETRHIRVIASVDILYPPTTLNNTFYGAHWWDLAVLTLLIFTLPWQIKLTSGKDN